MIGQRRPRRALVIDGPVGVVIDAVVGDVGVGRLPHAAVDRAGVGDVGIRWIGQDDLGGADGGAALRAHADDLCLGNRAGALGNPGGNAGGGDGQQHAPLERFGGVAQWLAI